MGFYRERIVPVLIDKSMRSSRLHPYRERIVKGAEGRILEVGIGSGHNLAYYGAGAGEIIGLDPSPRLLARTRERAGTLNGAGARPVLIEGNAEGIPLDTRAIDTVVMTWTGCSIPDVAAALAEIRRVLKPGGRLLFVEHGLAPDEGVARWQHRLTPIWRRIGGGCHLNRPFETLISGAGFSFETLDTGYGPGPRPLTYLYQGSARPA